MENYFKTLNEIDVGEHIEKKANLSYLSWAWAWQTLKLKHPNATYVVYENTLPNGYVVNYFTDGRYAYVKTGVIVEGIEHIEYLPVMDNRNNSIPLEKITSFNVNTAIQRSLTKAVARHGLGLYIYAGEDLPQIEEDKDTDFGELEQRNIPSKGIQDTNNVKGSISSDQSGIINAFLNTLSDDKREKWFAYIDKNFGTMAIEMLTFNQAQALVDKINKGVK